MYDDYALNPNSFELMAKEYNRQNKGAILGLKTKVCEISQDDVNSLFAKMEYLRVLVNELKTRTKNADILLVLDDVSSELGANIQNLSSVLNGGVHSSTKDVQSYKMFCNNLKLAINTTGDIVKLLVKIKDQDDTFELSQQLTDMADSFIDINNKLVSLFGECRYLKYSL